ncbi:MAG: YfcE family phosphodiesterase [Ruminococcaceae bacterium]|nr:YfcE family phosphodiesterase [Oscillospiraceae bacterium]
MKILVLSDSHSTKHYMRQFVERSSPDVIVHLGDHYEDGECLAEWYPHVILHQVAGNCDRYRCPPSAREMLCYPLGGVMTYMTHGHNHHVKLGLGALLKDARALQAKLVLFGHTHKAVCIREPDGLWVLNPGSAGSGTKTAGLVTIENGAVVNCEILST